MITFYLVDVKDITSDIPRTNFSEADLDILADMIIGSGGILRPLIIKATGAESYTIVDGHFEYYAAVRAREKNPRKGEMVNAFVISPKVEDLIVKQATFIRGVESYDKPVNTITETASSDSSRLANLELLIENQLNEFKLELAQERQRVEDKLKEIQSQIPKQITPLEAFNTLNFLELTYRLRTAGFTEKKAVEIAESIEKERKKKQFMSLSDVVMRVKISSGKKQIKGITSDKMVDIIDGWSRVLFV
jgi:hypothetical protein